MAAAHPEVYPAKHATPATRLANWDQYKAEHASSVDSDTTWWLKKAREELAWFREPTVGLQGGFEAGDVRWFEDGQLNVSYNCLDKHVLAGRGDDVAIVYESDEPGAPTQTFTYTEALRATCRIADVLTRRGVRKGDVVAIYMPMIPDLAFTMLACSRIGAVHSVVFSGFSKQALCDRILDGQVKWVCTADEGVRGGRVVPLKTVADAAVEMCSCVQAVFVFQHTASPDINYYPRDVRMEEALPGARPFVPAVTVDAEDPLFLLYTSGSTGKPKGVAHTTAGYLLCAKLTCEYVFDLQPGDTFACVADCGWITGHSYIVYGPMAGGHKSVMFASTPLYPDAGRYWDMVQRLGINVLYTSPTAVRALMKYSADYVRKYDTSSLRVLGSVGEPLNPEAWRWMYHVVGQERCSIVDTYFQTETGNIMVTPLPGVCSMKPGSASIPFFGAQPLLLDDQGSVITKPGVSGTLVMGRPWPSLARTVYGDHERYLTVYMKPYPGYYFTGDGAVWDEHGFLTLQGRIDDVLCPAGHRLGTAEIESALVEHPATAEAAVVGMPHDVKGEGICCYVILKEGQEESAELVQELKQQVRTSISPIATPDLVVITPALPKTRSGKIMRRILRKIVAGEADSIGDVSTLADPSVVDELIVKVAKLLQA